MVLSRRHWLRSFVMFFILAGGVFNMHGLCLTAQEADNSKSSAASALASGRWRWQMLETTGQPTPRHETSLVEHDGNNLGAGAASVDVDPLGQHETGKAR